jgi:acetyl-CoA synthetase/medium-chain acyl-CoA synthetase
MAHPNMRDYDSARSTFAWTRGRKYNFARDVIDKWADADPDKRALLWRGDRGDEEHRTFADIRSISRKLCNVLEGDGVKRGDVVILLLGRVPQWWEVFTACLRMGAVVSPGTTQLSARDLLYRITASKAVCVVTDQTNADKVDQIASDCRSLRVKYTIGAARSGWKSYADGLAGASDDYETADTESDESSICFFTSGTTGYPKMCIHTHDYALGHRITGEFWLDLKPDDLHWNISDTGWAKAAYSSYFGPWLCGTELFVHDAQKFNAAQILDLLERYPITTMCGAPTVYRMLVQEDLSRYKFQKLRHCASAGEPLNPEVIDIWKSATRLTIRDGYGQTENVILCANFLCLEPRYGSMGKPSPGYEVQIVDDAGDTLPANREGDIAVKIVPERPPGMFKEYKDATEKNAEVTRGNWYITGDRAYRDNDGYFWFVGRADDVILSAGYRIGPFEVESALLEHPAVAESAVVASPDETRGHVVKAFVVLANGYDASEDLKEELKEHVKHLTAPYKYPRKVEFVSQLPKTVSGKIRRVELREEP